MSRRGAIAIVFAVLLAVGLWLGLRPADGHAGTVAIGAQAPDFRGAVIDGSATERFKTIADYRGDVVLINLWATWCVPCVTEMPSIQRLYERFRDQGLKVVGIAVDDPPYAERVAAFVRERGLTFEILHEGSGKVEQDYRARGIPATYVIGRDGRIRMIRQGATDWDTQATRDVIAQLLGVAGPNDAKRTPASP